MPDAASARSAAAKAARFSAASSTTTGAEGQRLAIVPTMSATPGTVGSTTRISGTRSRSRISASSKRPPSRATSPRREPGRHSTSGASGAMSWAARKAAASSGVARGWDTTGWPTKSQLIPASCISGGSNGRMASTWSMISAMRSARPGRQAQTEGAT